MDLHRRIVFGRDRFRTARRSVEVNRRIRQFHFSQVGVFAAGGWRREIEQRAPGRGVSLLDRARDAPRFMSTIIFSTRVAYAAG